MTPMSAERCAETWDSPTGRTAICAREKGHDGPHTTKDGTATWVDPGKPSFDAWQWAGRRKVVRR